ncbi:hypothetical protein X970_20010 [Pseudomonas monteilii SB3101]|uniref:Transposase n=1 Tax=Pseudomonas monteilii SB3101 TaxID=1435058 RepID=V9V9W6_9PSED|nr:hypothetical protein [Pseudomonas monteilii]AHC85818.1 hypothetical protein X969_20375 [Pseudomonas monteilii SB3078]AHC91178.1 hypothetical protein X970_20010 [Pseudomonas monteilii SB3101]
MARVFSNAKQAKRYSDRERTAMIAKFRASGMTISNFCKQDDTPSYQVLKAWISELTLNPQSKASTSTSNINMMELNDETSNHSREHCIELMHERLENLQLQLLAIKHEVMKLEQASL